MTTRVRNAKRFTINRPQGFTVRITLADVIGLSGGVKKTRCHSCYSCHSWFGGEPLESGDWLRRKLGDGMIDILNEKKNSHVKVSKLEEKEIAKHYREQLKIIEKERADGATGYIDFESWQ